LSSKRRHPHAIIEGALEREITALRGVIQKKEEDITRLNRLVDLLSEKMNEKEREYDAKVSVCQNAVTLLSSVLCANSRLRRPLLATLVKNIEPVRGAQVFGVSVEAVTRAVVSGFDDLRSDVDIREMTSPSRRNLDTMRIDDTIQFLNEHAPWKSGRGYRVLTYSKNKLWSDYTKVEGHYCRSVLIKMLRKDRLRIDKLALPCVHCDAFRGFSGDPTSA